MASYNPKKIVLSVEVKPNAFALTAVIYAGLPLALVANIPVPVFK